MMDPSRLQMVLRTFPEEVAKSGCLMWHNATKKAFFSFFVVDFGHETALEDWPRMMERYQE